MISEVETTPGWVMGIGEWVLEENVRSKMMMMM
jgi:hypothetical protein